jgi:hypothetical protein
MTLGKMREAGIRSVYVECMACDREATVNVDRLPDYVPVPDVALVMKKLCCAACGTRGERLHVRPEWAEGCGAEIGTPTRPRL